MNFSAKQENRKSSPQRREDGNDRLVGLIFHVQGEHEMHGMILSEAKTNFALIIIESSNVYQNRFHQFVVLRKKASFSLGKRNFNYLLFVNHQFRVFVSEHTNSNARELLLFEVNPA